MSKANDRTGYFPIERGHVKWALMRDLADGLPSTQIYKKYNTTATSLDQFKKRHRAEIEELKSTVEAEMHHLWIASKGNRLAEYQQSVEDVEAALAALLQLGTTLGPQDMQLIKEKRALLRNVAEELGQLPSRNNVQVTGAQVNYVFDGIDPDALS